MITQYKQLLKYKGKEVKIYASSQSSHAMLEETGVITNLVIGLGENGVFLELDEKKIINVRYIIKMEVLDE